MSEPIKTPIDQLEQLKKRLKWLSQEKAALQLLYELISKLTPGAGLKETVRDILQITMDTIGSLNIIVYYRLDDHWFSIDIYGEEKMVIDFEDPLVRQAILEESFVEESGTDTLMMGALAEKFAAGKTWVFPLIIGKEVIGALKLEGIRLAFSSDIKDQLQVFVNYISLVLQDEIMNFSKLKQAYNSVSETNEALIKSEEQVRLLLNSTAEAIYGLDIKGRCTFCNPSCLKLLGYKSEKDLIGKNIHVLIHHTRADGAPHPVDECRIYQVYKNKVGIHADDEILWRADGSFFYAEYWSYPVFREDEVMGAVVTFLDITERKNAEQEQEKLREQLIQSQKMESVGRLAAGIAHDFNNYLSTIIGYSELAELRLPEDDPLRHDIGIIREAGEKSAMLTRQLLAFSRKQVLKMKVVDLNAILKSLSRLLVNLIGEDVVIETRTESPVRKILADPGQIEQVLMNLAVNARDAMPCGGRLLLSTSDVELDEEYAGRYEGVTAGPYVRVSVSDTGEGMSRRVQNNIFEPFFTTKGKGKGTGLGLATAHGIVKQHGGHIQVDSELGKGTTFKLYFPASTQEETQAAGVRFNGTTHLGTETILVVDDEPAIRSLVMDLLTPLGYKVLAANGAEEALKIGESMDETIDLLLTDVVMPGMYGNELSETLKQRHPETKTVFMSGYTDDAIAHHGVLAPGLHFLQKPLTPVSLIEKLREVLEAS